MTDQRLERIKNDERLVLSFYFVSLVLNVVVFVYNGSKQSHILQTMPYCLLQIYFFHRNLIYVYLKNSILRCMWRDLGMSLPLCQSHWFASLILLQKFVLILPGTYSLSDKEKKKADTVCICKFNHSILSETGKITNRFFNKFMFSEDGLKV